MSVRVIRAAHNDLEQHDKVYVVGIVANGSGFDVVARWGKRAASLPSTNRKVYHSGLRTLEEADRMASSTLRNKTGSGYVDVESTSYNPRKGRYSVEQAKAQFGEPLAGATTVQPTPKPAAKPAPAKPAQTKAEQKGGKFVIPAGVEVLVICVDASGAKTSGGMDVRDGYDEGDEYVACASALGDKYVSVSDRFGKFRSVPQEQFKLVATVGA
jgi:hypothetical protein